jgi:alkylation response protein AidB-like acyl-CoA dehydrogenase
MPDLGAVRAFLEPHHVDVARRVGDFVTREIAPLPEPADDAAARAQARDILGRLGRAGWYAPIAEQHLRDCCLIRETLAAASPLADAVFALQALGALPILLAGHDDVKRRWMPAVLDGARWPRSP